MRGTVYAIAALIALLFITPPFIPFSNSDPMPKHPVYVPFSNDGPLGTVVADQANPLNGSWANGWQDLNWLGGRFEAPGPSISMGFRILCFLGHKVLIALAILILCASLPWQWLIVKRADRFPPWEKYQRWIFAQYCAAGSLWTALFLASLYRHVFIEYTNPEPLIGAGGCLFGCGIALQIVLETEPLEVEGSEG